MPMFDLDFIWFHFYYHRSRAKLGYVRLTNLMSKKTVQKYNVAKNSDTMLVFHENPSHPVAFVSSFAIYLSKISKVFKCNHNYKCFMPCPSMGPKWFWTVQIILVEYQSFSTGPICFGWVQIILDRSKS